MSQVVTKQQPRVFYGWWVLLSICGISFYIAGAFWYGFSVFIPSFTEEFGWSRAQISLALTLQGLEGIGAAPIIGLFVDRIGARRLMVFGLFVAGLGISILSLTNSLMWLYASYLLISIGTSAGAGLVYQALVVRWFYQRRGIATTSLIVMPGLGATVLIPILTWLIHSVGWRTSLVFIGFGLWVIAIPVLLIVRNSPEGMGLKPDGSSNGDDPNDQASMEQGFTIREVVRLRSFWFLVFAFMLWNFGTNGIQPHLYVALLGIGIPDTMSTLVVALFPGISLIGRIAIGFMSDFVDKRFLLAVSAASMAVGVAMLALLMLNTSHHWLLYPFLAFYSIGFGGSIPIRVVTSGNYFGRAHFPAVYGTIQAMTSIGGVIAPLFAGWIFDTTGSYFVAYAISAVVLLLSVPLVFMAKNPQSQTAALP